MAWTETPVRGEILAAMLLIMFKAQFGLKHAFRKPYLYIWLGL